MNAKELYRGLLVHVRFRPTAHLAAKDFSNQSNYALSYRGRILQIGNRSDGGHLVRVWENRNISCDVRLHGKNITAVWTDEDETKYNEKWDRIEFETAKAKAVAQVHDARRAEQTDLMLEIQTAMQALNLRVSQFGIRVLRLEVGNTKVEALRSFSEALKEIVAARLTKGKVDV